MNKNAISTEIIAKESKVGILRVLKDNKSIKDLELLQQQINNEEKLLIENK